MEKNNQNQEASLGEPLAKRIKLEPGLEAAEVDEAGTSPWQPVPIPGLVIKQEPLSAEEEVWEDEEEYTFSPPTLAATQCLHCARAAMTPSWHRPVGLDSEKEIYECSCVVSSDCSGYDGDDESDRSYRRKRNNVIDDGYEADDEYEYGRNVRTNNYDILFYGLFDIDDNEWFHYTSDDVIRVLRPFEAYELLFEEFCRAMESEE